MEKKIGIISQARMTSTRLPGKILKRVQGKALLSFHIDRLRLSGLPIYIATTTNKTDDVVEDFANKENILVYRGDEENVLKRYYECAMAHHLDVIIRVTSDCPLIDGKLIREEVVRYLSKNDPNLYSSNCLERTFPRGFDFEIFSFQSLKVAYENATESADLEHVTPYINKNKSGKIQFYHVLNTENSSHIRITVDTLDDFTLIEKLIVDYQADEMDAQAISALFKKNPELLKINGHIEQKKA